MTRSRIRAAAAGILAAALALSGCSLLGGESTREFCVVADDIVDIGNVEKFTAFATLVNFGGSGDDFPAEVRDALTPAVEELRAFAELMAEAGRASTDADTIAAFEQLNLAYVGIADAAEEAYADVASSSDVADAALLFQESITAIVEGGTIDDASYAADDAMFDACGVTISGAAIDPSVDRAIGNAKSDVSTLGKEIATYFVDAVGPPAGDFVAIEGDKWLVAGEIVGYVSDNIELTDQYAVTSTNWCVQVTETEQQVSYSYSAQQGLTDIACADQLG